MLPNRLPLAGVLVVVGRLPLARRAEVVHHAGDPHTPPDQLEDPELGPAHREVDRDTDVGKGSTEQPVHDDVVVTLGRRLPGILVLVRGVGVVRRQEVDDTTHAQRDQSEPRRSQEPHRNLPSEVPARRHDKRQAEISRQECPGLPLPEGDHPQEHVARLPDICHEVHGIGDGTGDDERPPEGGTRQNGRQLGHRITIQNEKGRHTERHAGGILFLLYHIYSTSVNRLYLLQ